MDYPLPTEPPMMWVAVRRCGCVTAAHVDGTLDDPRIVETLAGWRTDGRRAERRLIGNTVLTRCPHIPHKGLL